MEPPSAYSRRFLAAVGDRDYLSERPASELASQLLRFKRDHGPNADSD